jgi:hypothetical protein
LTGSESRFAADSVTAATSQRYGARIVMNAILALLVLCALVGLLLGLYFTWIAIVLAEPILAIFSAVVLQRAGFDVLPGIATIVACLAVSQIAYLAGVNLLARVRGE